MAEGFFSNPGELASRFIDLESVPWVESGPGNKMKVIYYDKNTEMLTLLTKRPVTDPTSGFCAFGPRAIAILAEHHPTGYPEPELQLFLSRNQLAVIEVPVSDRPRLSGTTSLTAGRATVAGARVLLAMIVVPLRGRVASRL